MEFSTPIAVTRSLLLELPGTGIIASANGTTLSMHTLPDLALAQEYALPAAPHHLCCTPHPPHTVAASSASTVTLITVADDRTDSAVVHITLPHTPVASVTLAPSAAIVFHSYGLGASVFPLRHHRSGPRAPVLLPHVATPRAPGAPGEPPSTVAMSPCGRYVALALKLPDGAPAVQVVALPRGDIVAEAAGAVALGGKVTRVAGVRWLPAPQSAMLVWGAPVDGPDAVCLLGLDCTLLRECMPAAASRTNLSGGGGWAGAPPGSRSSPSPGPRRRRRQRWTKT
jgi:hypothetical protein